MKFLRSASMLWVLPGVVVLLIGATGLISIFGSDAQFPAALVDPAPEEVAQVPLSGTPEPRVEAPAAVPAAPSASPLPPTPTATPAPELRPLTDGGCCVQAFWHPDGLRLLFLDKPGENQSSGLWSVDLNGTPPQLFTQKVGLYSPDMQYRAYLSGGVTTVERLADGQTWAIPNDGRAVVFSPDSSWLAWTAGQNGPPYDTARREIWVSRADGSQARVLMTVYSGGFVDWFPDGSKILVSGKIESTVESQSLLALSFEPKAPVDSPEEMLQSGRLTLLAQGNRLRDARLSPDGRYLAYQVTMELDESKNGLWVVETQSGFPSQRLPLYGAYRWRDASRLLVIPLAPGEPQRLWQFDLNNLEAGPTLLTDPQITPFTITNGDWSISPNGRYVAFLSAQDHNLWLIDLTPTDP